MTNDYEKVIGLEVHVELASKTKIFCGCSTAFGGAPNSHTCPVCTGMPGSLPVLNRQVVEYAMAVGLAVSCEISRCSRFDRKNYFYPDNPQNYQISQLYEPICRNGHIDITTEQGTRSVGIREIHMEEDAGKLIHDEREEYSLVDFNRSGVPLIEIVSEPDMRSAEEVISYLEKLRLILQYLGASDCKLQEGSMRVDVNLSIRRAGSSSMGTRTEMKNLNSFKAISRAISAEADRQKELLHNGKEIVQETRRWDDAKECSYTMRSKEDARDYRYFPEPDLPPVMISDEWIEDVRARQPELPAAKRIRYIREYGLSEYDAELITSSKHLADIFEETADICRQPKKAANWLMGETLRLLNERHEEPEAVRFSAEHLASLIMMAESKEISGAVAKKVFEEMYNSDIDPIIYVEENSLKSEQDEEALRRIVKKVINENQKSVNDYRGGKKKARGFLIGMAMKETGGKAAPESIERLLTEELE